MTAVNQCVSRAGLEEFDQALAHVELLNPVEEVEEAAGMDDGDLAAQAGELLVVGIEHVTGNKGDAET